MSDLTNRRVKYADGYIAIFGAKFPFPIDREGTIIEDFGINPRSGAQVVLIDWDDHPDEPNYGPQRYIVGEVRVLPPK